jgi:hypothetical protein
VPINPLAWLRVLIVGGYGIWLIMFALNTMRRSNRQRRKWNAEKSEKLTALRARHRISGKLSKE